MMGHALAVDFEGDQWTFFKPRPEDLERLYGIDIHEMQPYRPLPEQIAEQIEQGRTIAVELDSWYLPDTAATSYRSEHVKRSVVAEAIDLDAEPLRYFHGPGYFELAGEDYRGVFRLGRAFSDDVLPPYTELVRFDAGPSLRGKELRTAARRAARRSPGRRSAERTRSSASARSSSATCRACSRATPAPTTTTPSRPCAWSARPSRSAGSHVEWLLGAGGRPACDAIGEIVDGLQGALLQARPPPRLRPRARRLPTLPPPGSETVAGVGDALA